MIAPGNSDTSDFKPAALSRKELAWKDRAGTRHDMCENCCLITILFPIAGYTGTGTNREKDKRCIASPFLE